MNHLIRAELGKLRTTRVLTILSVLVAGLTTALIAMQLANAGKLGAPSLGTAESLRSMLSVVGTLSPAVLIVGVLAVTMEFRHATIASSLLAVPDRRHLMLTKATALAIVGVVVALGGLVLELAIVVPYLSSAGVPFDLADPDLLLTVSGVLAAIPLYAVAGVGLGAVMRHQTIAVVVPLVWLGVVENLLPSFGLIQLLRWLPGGATNALARNDLLPGVLPMWAGGLLLAAYAAVFVLIGIHRVDRADV
jgi:ABC-2 type transport system permease protein